MIRITCLLAVCALVFSCGGKKEKPVEETPIRNVKVPAFNSDSAFYFVEKHGRVGPRIPNTRAHKSTGEYLVTKLKQC